MAITPKNLLTSQLEQWPLAAKNYDELKSVSRRNVSDSHLNIYLQFNPNRILSSAAQMDKASIESRPCFLCPHHLPKEQIKTIISNEYQLLVNPYPIFNQHFTIPTYAHTPQRIEHSLEFMLDGAQRFPELILFYNGPKCGASAPDHLHFQAGNRTFLPIEADYQSKTYCETIVNQPSITISRWHNYLRPVFTFEGNNKELILRYFHHFYLSFKMMQPNEDEPMLNIITYYESNYWIIHFFPRQLHRPHQYFATGDDQILISPASVDMGGVLVLPREQDYQKMTIDDVTNIYDQVCLNQSDMDILQSHLTSLNIK